MSRLRRILLLLSLIAVALTAGASLVRAQGSADPLDAALGYLPADADAVAAVRTDVGGEQLLQLDAKLRRLDASEPATSISQAVRSAAKEAHLNYDRNIKPLLGNELAVAIVSKGDDFSFVAAIKVPRMELIKAALKRPRALGAGGRVLGKRVYRLEGGSLLAVNGDELVLTDSRRTLVAALRRRERPDRLTRDVFERRVGAPATPTVARGYVDAGRGLARELGADTRTLRRLPWLDALRTIGFSGQASPSGLSGSVFFNTPARRLATRDLPLAAGAEPPLVVRRPREIVTAQRDVGRSAAFLLDLSRVADPRGAFERRRRRVESASRVDLRRDLAAQFTGNSVLTTSPRGRWGWRADVRDPAALAATLRRLQPRLGGLLGAASGERGPKVTRLRGERALYRLTFPTRADKCPRDVPRAECDLIESRGPDTVDPVFFGVEGGRWIAGSDLRAARRLAAQQLVPAPAGLSGSGLFVARPRYGSGDFDRRIRNRIDLLAGSWDATPRRVRIDGRLDIP